MRLFFKLILMLLMPWVVSAKELFPNLQSGAVGLDCKMVIYDAEKSIVEAVGDVIVVYDDYILFADSLSYDIEKKKLWADGRIKIKNTKEEVIIADNFLLNHKSKDLIVEKLIIKLADNSILTAGKAQIIDKYIIELYKAKYTPCKICQGKDPFWEVDAKRVEVNNREEVMSYNHALFKVRGVPIMYAPYFSHPTPNAKARSGMLIPSLYRGSFRVPFYYRAKSYMDFTFTPRIIADQSTGSFKAIHEFNARYLSNAGLYNLQANFIEEETVEHGSDKKKGEIKVIPFRYHITSNADFKKGNYIYGFEFDRASDKAFLKNYYDINSSYLTSRLYMQNVRKSNYVSVESLVFQDMNSVIDNRDIVIVPDIVVKQQASLSEDKKTTFTAKNNTANYNDNLGKEVMRSATTLSLNKVITTSSGNIFNIEGYNRSDMYYITKDNINKKENNQRLYRNIPELRLNWQYPMVKTFVNNKRIYIEPRVDIAYSLADEKNKNFTQIDSKYYSVERENIFNYNKYAGIDFHEYGSRVAYGIYSFYKSSVNRINLFMGRQEHIKKNNTFNNEHLVGQFSINHNDIFDLYYHFKKKKNFAPLSEILGLNVNRQKTYFGITYTDRRSVNFFDPIAGENVIFGATNQVNTNMNYKVTDNWMLGGELRFDVRSRKNKKVSLLSRTMKVTYINDCASIEARLSNDYTEDISKNIKKTSNYSVSIGLKNINM